MQWKLLIKLNKPVLNLVKIITLQSKSGLLFKFKNSSTNLSTYLFVFFLHYNIIAIDTNFVSVQLETQHVYLYLQVVPCMNTYYIKSLSSKITMFYLVHVVVVVWVESRNLGRYRTILNQSPHMLYLSIKAYPASKTY